MTRVVVWVLAGCIVIWPVVALWSVLDARRLEPPHREVAIKELDKGYLVQARTTTNPYPYYETAALDPKDATAAAQALLTKPVPKPRWGE